MSSPAVILKSKFIMPGDKEYEDYVEYIDREDAKMNLHLDDKQKTDDFHLSFDRFVDYMDDDEKKGELFTKECDSLTNDQKKELKKAFTTGQSNGSPLWQDVISFDNKWLEEQNIYDSKTNAVDEKKLKDVVRGSVSELLGSENMNDSAVWSASIHYNTDNIHVHIATVEPIPTRKKMRYFDKEKKEWTESYRGKRKQGSLEKMKSKVVNQIVDRTKEYNRINALIRGSVHAKEQNRIKLSSYRKTKKLFHGAMAKLPSDLSQWKYGYQSINEARPYIDEIVDIYLETYHGKEMEKLNELLDEQVDISRKLYGDGSQHEKYKQTKLDDLKKRMGNAVLSEMRAYKKNERLMARQSFNQTDFSTFKQSSWRGLDSILFSLYRLNGVMRKSYHEYKNEQLIDEYDRMLEGRE